MWRQQEIHCPGDPLGREISPIKMGYVPLSAVQESISGHCVDTVVDGYGLRLIEELVRQSELRLGRGYILACPLIFAQKGTH